MRICLKSRANLQIVRYIKSKFDRAQNKRFSHCSLSAYCARAQTLSGGGGGGGQWEESKGIGQFYGARSEIFL